ncbi:MAG: universal stress protein [bacterium]
MSSTKQGFILVGVDNSERSNAAVDYAIWLAKSNQTPVKFLHIIEHNSLHTEQANHEGNLTPNIRRELLQELSDEEYVESKKQIIEGKELLKKVETKAIRAGLENVIIGQRHGSLAESIVDLGDETALFMVGSKGEDHGESKGLGSQLEDAIRASEKPVFIVKKSFSEPHKMMFAYNGSPTSRKALELIKLGTFCHQSFEIHVVCVQNNQDDAIKLANEAKQILAAGKDNITTAPLVGEAIELLIDYQHQNNIDITAMGAFSHGKMHGFFFGSFTTRMLLESQSNFLLIR